MLPLATTSDVGRIVHLLLFTWERMRLRDGCFINNITDLYDCAHVFARFALSKDKIELTSSFTLIAPNFDWFTCFYLSYFLNCFPVTRRLYVGQLETMHYPEC